MKTHKLTQEQTRRRYQVAPRRSKLFFTQSNTARARATASENRGTPANVDRQHWRGTWTRSAARELRSQHLQPHAIWPVGRSFVLRHSTSKMTTFVPHLLTVDRTDSTDRTSLRSQVERGRERGGHHAFSIKRIGAVILH